MWMNKNQPAQNLSFNKFLRMSDPQEGDENAKTENRITCWITFFRPILLKRILAPPLGNLYNRFFGEEITNKKLK